MQSTEVAYLRRMNAGKDAAGLYFVRESDPIEKEDCKKDGTVSRKIG